MDTISKSQSRFEISNEGWKRLNAGRNINDLIREAVANAFDQDNVTCVKVRLTDTQIGSSTRLHVEIEDDSPTGIGDPSLITTIFMTNKESSNKQRGRKGRGIKELISAATYAEVDTVGYTIKFADGREVVRSTRTVGTLVSADLDLRNVDISVITHYLSKFIPPNNMTMYVNGHVVKSRKTRAKFKVYLPTIFIKNGIQEESYDYGLMHIVNLGKGEKYGYLYEMGIPVELLGTPFHVDVQQRIPINDDRDCVPNYVTDIILGYCLDGLVDNLNKAALKHEWATKSLFSSSKTTQEKFIKKLFGATKPIAIKSSNARANKLAQDSGMQVVDCSSVPSSIESSARSIFKTTDDIVKELEDNNKGTAVPVHVADPNATATALVMFICEQVLNKSVDVEYYSKETVVTKPVGIDYDRDNSKVRINVLADINIGTPANPKFIGALCKAISNTDDDIANVAGMISCAMLKYRNSINAILA